MTPTGKFSEKHLTSKFFSRYFPAESTCLDNDIVPLELGVSSISFNEVPYLCSSNVSSLMEHQDLKRYQLKLYWKHLSHLLTF